jgi:uncharacterized phage-associated protein
MDGDVESTPGGWGDMVSDKEDHELSLRRPLDVDDLDEMSPAEINVLKAVWMRFGSMGKWEIRDWTHQHCDEWQDPRGSSFPIEYEALARAVGYDAQAADELAAQIKTQQEIDRLFVKNT